MDWTGSGSMTPNYRLLGNSLTIERSLIFENGMTTSAAFTTPSVYFTGTNRGNVIKGGNVVMPGLLEFNGAGGEWKLTDSLILRTIYNSLSSLRLNSGTLNTNNYNISTIGGSYGYKFDVYGDSLILGSSTINLGNNQQSTFKLFNNQSVYFDAGTSHILAANIVSSGTESETFYNVSSVKNITGNSATKTTFNKAVFNAGEVL